LEAQGVQLTVTPTASLDRYSPANFDMLVFDGLPAGLTAWPEGNVLVVNPPLNHPLLPAEEMARELRPDSTTASPMLAGIDFAEVWDVLQNAHWSVIAIAFLVGETVFIPQAMGMMYAVGGQIPFWPLVTLQVAIMFIGLAVPSAAGRVAMNSAFLHKFGYGVTVSITQGALDSLSGFAVEASILLIALLTTDLDLGLDVDTDDVRWGLVLLIVVVIALVVVGLFRWVRRLREHVLPELRKGWDALVDLGKTPSRALGLLGSNLLTRLVWGTTLWLVLQAIDAPLSFIGALVAVVATNLLQGLVPVPGGIGVSETVMTGFLVALGVDENSAFAATITYRMITFYIPSGVGFFATKWLERHEYL
jgi:uncharacterized membrane protein YbhN (UPF0104 family)